MKRPVFLTYEDVLAAALLAGSAAGCAAAHLLREELAGSAGLWQAYTAGLSGRQQHLLWESVVRQRGLQLALLCLAAAAPPARLLFALSALAMGFGGALLLSLLTLRLGWIGLAAFAGLLLPQWLCYGTVWAVLAAAAKKGAGRIRPGAWLLLAGLSAAGMALEAWVNPLLWRFLPGI